VGVSPLGEGVAVGSVLPDSINVVRTGRIAPGLLDRPLGRRDSFGCSERVSFFAGLAVSETTGVAVGEASEADSRAFAGCEDVRVLSRSAASAPAIRICSSVGSADAGFFSRDLALGGSGVANSEGVSSAAGVACLEASGFVSRATMTSCPCIHPTRIKPQSRIPKNPVSLNCPANDLRPANKPLFTSLSLCSARWTRDPDHRQGKTHP
jgi:hypothetical protein